MSTGAIVTVAVVISVQVRVRLSPVIHVPSVAHMPIKKRPFLSMVSAKTWAEGHGREKDLIGEKLFPMVLVHFPLDRIDPMARAVTGMLLEMDNGLLLEMLGCDEKLKDMVDQIMPMMSGRLIPMISRTDDFQRMIAQMTDSTDDFQRMTAIEVGDAIAESCRRREDWVKWRDLRRDGTAHQRMLARDCDREAYDNELYDGRDETPEQQGSRLIEAALAAKPTPEMILAICRGEPRFLDKAFGGAWDNDDEWENWDYPVEMLRCCDYTPETCPVSHTVEMLRAWLRRMPPPPPPTIESLSALAGYKRIPETGDWFRTVQTGRYNCMEFSAPPSDDGGPGGTCLGRLDKGSWLRALEVRVVLTPADPKRWKPDPEYGIAILHDGGAWVNVSRNKVAYAWLCELVTAETDDGGTKQYVCCMDDLLPLDENPGIPMSCFSERSE